MGKSGMGNREIGKSENRRIGESENQESEIGESENGDGRPLRPGIPRTKMKGRYSDAVSCKCNIHGRGARERRPCAAPQRKAGLGPRSLLDLAR